MLVQPVLHLVSENRAEQLTRIDKREEMQQPDSQFIIDARNGLNSESSIKIRHSGPLLK
jgi:hypothetical protein